MCKETNLLSVTINDRVRIRMYETMCLGVLFQNIRELAKSNNNNLQIYII
jgi:hypothetical protein